MIISVAGAFRKGKSFLLNFFLEYLYNLHKSQQSDSSLEWLTDDCQLHGFHWRAGVKRDTVGGLEFLISALRSIFEQGGRRAYHAQKNLNSKNIVDNINEQMTKDIIFNLCQ